MSKVQRKEYHESKYTRTMSPTVRYGGSAQNVTEFDNSLDHLLDDLQSTVSRPGSSMTNGTTYRESSRQMTSNSDASNRSHSLSRVINTKPVTEYSTDDSYTYTAPDGTKHMKTVKKESYSYKTSSGDGATENVRMQNNINQLDSLLDDLQQVKQAGVYNNNNNVAMESGYQQYSKSKVVSGKKIIERDVVPYTERTRSLDRSERDGSSVHSSREMYHHNEGTYGRTVSPSPTRSNTSTLSKQTKMTNVHAYPVEVVETVTPDINPEILANLDPELLPSGNTKVTTTIKTYTYEIPGAGGPVDPDKYTYTPNQSATTPSKSFVYNKYENNSLTRNYQPPSSPHSDRKIIKETVTTRNYQPNKVVYDPPTGGKTYIYNESTTTRNYNDHHQSRTDHHQSRSDHHQSRSTTPRNAETYIVKETHHNTVTNRSDSPDHGHLPPVNTTIHKFDSMSNLNARQYPDTETFDPKHPPYGGTPPSSPQHYPPEVNVTYKYRSTSNTTNKYRGDGYPGDEGEPLLPRKFPTDELEGPPKKLDDLMASMGKEPPTNAYNIGWRQHEEEIAQQRKVDSLKAQHEFESQKKEERKEAPRTKNVSGPPVYYPPGHEMFAKKEEAGGGAWRAEGAMARERGAYQYESESKSKTKSSSGAAIVPVCLPLCCGLPCTII